MEPVDMNGAPIWLRTIVWVFSMGSVVLGFVLVLRHLIRESDRKTEAVVKGAHSETARQLSEEFQTFREESAARENYYQDIGKALAEVAKKQGEQGVKLDKLSKDIDAFHEWKRDVTPMIATLIERDDT